MYYALFTHLLRKKIAIIAFRIATTVVLVAICVYMCNDRRMIPQACFITLNIACLLFRAI